MPRRRKSQISLRKAPKQARSNELVAAILKAAVQVLATEGAQRFTTARVAARAGVSVGSLYQYFPNKAAILFSLQTSEWQQTDQMLREILLDRAGTPFERLRELVHAFVQSECDEAALRVALSDAAPLYREAPEARNARATHTKAFQTFLLQAMPRASKSERALAGDLIQTTLSTVAKRISETPRRSAAVETYSDAMADMFCGYLSIFDRAERRTEVLARRF